VIDFHPFQWALFRAALTQTLASVIHINALLLGECYSLAFLVEEVVSQFLNEITERLVAKLYVVSLA
jgi:hypothetical protein